MTRPTRDRHVAALLVFAFGLAWASLSVASPAGGAVALQGGDVYVGDGRVLRGATIVLRDGRIESVGRAKGPLVGVEVIDVSGHRVREFELPSLASGERRVAWDGRDARGNTLAAGRDRQSVER